jgi:hypothetical protein
LDSPQLLQNFRVASFVFVLEPIDTLRLPEYKGSTFRGGFMGRIDFSGDFAPFWGYLVLGEIVHVGKGSSFGLGKSEILRDEIEGNRK